MCWGTATPAKLSTVGAKSTKLTNCVVIPPRAADDSINAGTRSLPLIGSGKGVPSSLDANPADVSSLPPALVGTSSQQARYPWALAALGAYLRASELSLDAGEAVSPMLLKGEAAARAALRQFGYPRTIDSFAGRALKAGVGWSKKQNDGAADDGGVTSPETREGGGAEAFRFGGSNQPKKAKGKENGGPRNAGAGASWWKGRKSANKNTPETSGLSERGDDAIAEQEHTSKSGQMKFKF